MSKIRTQVMASVVVIYTLRQFISGTALRAYGLLVAFVSVASFVSVGDVIQNLITVGFSGAGQLVLYALLHTAGVVQVLSLAVAIFALLLLRDIIRGASRTLAFA